MILVNPEVKCKCIFYFGKLRFTGSQYCVLCSMYLVALAGLLNSVMMTPSSTSVGTTASCTQLGELGGLLAAVPPSPLTPLSGSPISAAIAAANLLAGPLPSKHSNCFHIMLFVAWDRGPQY